MQGGDMAGSAAQIAEPITMLNGKQPNLLMGLLTGGLGGLFGPDAPKPPGPPGDFNGPHTTFPTPSAPTPISPAALIGGGQNPAALAQLAGMLGPRSASSPFMPGAGLTPPIGPQSPVPLAAGFGSGITALPPMPSGMFGQGVGLPPTAPASAAPAPLSAPSLADAWQPAGPQ